MLQPDSATAQKLTWLLRIVIPKVDLSGSCVLVTEKEREYVFVAIGLT
jgi:hypothetical protein